MTASLILSTTKEGGAALSRDRFNLSVLKSRHSSPMRLLTEEGVTQKVSNADEFTAAELRAYGSRSTEVSNVSHIVSMITINFGRRNLH